MKTIQITDSELNGMKKFYLEEYNQTASRLLHITTMLNRLGIEIPQGEITDNISSAGSAPLIGSAQKTPSKRKKPGRKSKWELVIIKRLRQLDRPVSYDQLTDEIMAFSKLPAQKRTSTKQAVVNVIFRLRNRDHKVDTFSMGTREKYIALKNWFESPGKIKKEYAAKVELPAGVKKKTKRKVGRPRKNS